MATFRCVQSGNTITLMQQHDIDTMRGHAGYVRVDEKPAEQEVKPLPMIAPPKKMGRPFKIKELS